jgi:hypothetical protein
MQQHQQPQAYQTYDYTSSPVFVHGPSPAFQMQTPPPTRGSSTTRRRPQRLESATTDPSPLYPPEFNPAAFSFVAPPHNMESWTQPSGLTPAPLSAPAWTANVEDPFAHWSSQPSQPPQPSAPAPASSSQSSAPSRPGIIRSTSSNNVPYNTPTTVSSSQEQTHLYASPVATHFSTIPEAPTASSKKPCLAPTFRSTSGPSFSENSGLSISAHSAPSISAHSAPSISAHSAPSISAHSGTSYSTSSALSLSTASDPSFYSTSGPVVPQTAGTGSPVKASAPLRIDMAASFSKSSPNIVSHNQEPSAPLARSNSACNISRRSSPLKRTARGSLSSIAETPRPRTSVVLTIDANGTARTETRLIEESPISLGKETRSAKEKYPNLWDDDSDSDSDTTSSSQWPSRHDSLAQATGGQERSAKVARLDTSSDCLEMVQLPRSNSTASLKTPCKAAYAAAIQLRRQSSAKKQQRPSSVHSRRSTLSSLNGSFENLAAMDLNRDEKHMKSVGSRISPPGTNMSKLSKPCVMQANHYTAPVVRPDSNIPKVSRPRQLSQPQRPHQLQQVQQAQQDGQVPYILEHHQQVQQAQPQVFRLQPPPSSDQNYVSTHVKSHSVSYPMATSTGPVFDPRGSFTMDYTPVAFAPIPTPTTFTNDMTPMTRCICQIPFDDGRMVQCNMCAMYSHSSCIGFTSSQQAAYVCPFCINHPILYQHPVRSSSMQTPNAWPVSGL